METKRNKKERMLRLHDCNDETPAEEGCYLVVVKEVPHTIYPKTELDSLIDIPGEVYYSIADWDGDEWTNIHYDCDIYSLEEDEMFHVIMWADRQYV